MQRESVTYSYRDKDGNLLFQVIRFGSGKEKDFKVRRHDNYGGWTWGLGDIKPVIYRFDEVTKADRVVIVEGERDVDNLREWGFTVTTNPFGAGKWRPEYSEVLRDKDVIIIPDMDEPGKNHAGIVANSLQGIARSIRIAKLPDDLPPGGDISDCIERLKIQGMHHPDLRKELITLIEEAPEWVPQHLYSSLHNSFNLIKASDLLKQPVEETRWIWEGILPQGGMSLLVAKPKVGKTTLALNLAVAVSRGEDLLGRATEQAPVVFLALEEKGGELRERLSAIGVGDDEPLYLHLGLAPRGAIGEIDNLISTSGAGLLIVDTLQKLARVRDLNDYAQVTNALEPLLGVARARNCHILLTHHAGKSERTDGDEILGSTALLGGVDSAILLKKREQGRTLSTVQRYGENLQEMVVVLNNDYSLTLSGTLDEAKKQETWHQIRPILEAHGPLTEAEIIAETNCRKADTSASLRWAFNQGSVYREGEGKKGAPYKYRILPPLPPVYMPEGEKQKQKMHLTNENHWDNSTSQVFEQRPNVGREKSAALEEGNESDEDLPELEVLG